MVLIYFYDIIPILIACIAFSLLAMAHKVFVPSKYSSFLQFKEDEDVNKTIKSTVIRIIYLIIGTYILNKKMGLSGKQIGIGIFIACFLNVWPAIIQNQLLKVRKNKTEWLILMGYIAFIIISILVEIMTIKLFIPILEGNKTLYWLDNQAISLIVSLGLMVVPVSIEAIISKFARIVIVQTIDTLKEEIYILEHQLNMECQVIEKNKYIIEKVAKENDINVTLLETILRLEIFYRGREYNKLLEKFICQYCSSVAIKKDISVGIGQIKISTAEKVLRTDAVNFIKQICKDEINIEICGKFLKELIKQYGYMSEQNEDVYENYQDIYDYIACEYRGAFVWQKDQTTLIYSAVLRSFMNEKNTYYTGGEQTGRCSVYLYKNNAKEIRYKDLQEFKKKIEDNVVITKEVFVKNKKMIIEFICDDEEYIGFARSFSDIYDCKILISDE